MSTKRGIAQREMCSSNLNIFLVLEVIKCNLYNFLAILYHLKKIKTSGQVGGLGKHFLPPHKTTSKLQLNYRTTITQNHKKLS